MEKLKIVGIGGSTAPSCSSSRALRFALQSAEREGAETMQFEIRDMDLPLYREDHKEVPSQVQALVKAVSEAHGLIWASPLYHGTVSGAFKNAIDWLQLLADHQPPYLSNKVVGLIATAGGVQGLQAINTMEYIVRALRGWTVPLVVPVSYAAKAFDVDGKPTDPKVEGLLHALGKEVVKGAKKMGQ